MELLLSDEQLALKHIRFWLNSVAIHTMDLDENNETNSARFAFIGTRKDKVTDFTLIDEKLKEQFLEHVIWKNNIHNSWGNELCFLPIDNTSEDQSDLFSFLAQLKEVLKFDKSVNTKVPITWIKLMDDIVNIGESFIYYERILEMLENYDISSDLLPVILTFFYGMGKLMWINEPHLKHLIILDPIDYFVKPATMIICKHFQTTEDTRIHTNSAHLHAKDKFLKDWKQMLEFALVTENLAREILKDWETQHIDNVLSLMCKFSLMVSLRNSDPGKSRVFFVPALLPENPATIHVNKFDRINYPIVCRFKAKYENLMKETAKNSFYFAFFIHYCREFDDFSLLDLPTLQRFGFLPNGLFERLIARLLDERITVEMIEQNNSNLAAFRDVVKIRYGNYYIKLTNCLLKNLIQVDILDDDVDPLPIHDSLLKIILSLIIECYGFLTVSSFLLYQKSGGTEDVFIKLSDFQKWKNDDFIGYTGEIISRLEMKVLQKTAPYSSWSNPVLYPMIPFTGNQNNGIRSVRHQIFLSHDWGFGPEYLNHKRVVEINDLLQERGISTWIDNEQNRGNMRDCIATAIDETEIFAVCLTENYNNKIFKSTAKDWCYYELNFASSPSSKCQFLMVLVMEDSMLNKDKWCCRLRAECSQLLYFDFTTIDEESITRLFDEIQRVSTVK